MASTIFIVQTVLVIAEVILCSFGLLGNAICSLTFLHPLLASGTGMLLFAVAIVDTLICISVPLIELTRLFLPAAYAHAVETSKVLVRLSDPVPRADMLVQPDNSTELRDTLVEGFAPWFPYVWALQYVFMAAAGGLIVSLCLNRFCATIGWLRERPCCFCSNATGILFGILTVIVVCGLSSLVGCPYFLTIYSERDPHYVLALPAGISPFHERRILPLVLHVIPVAVIVLAWFFIVAMLVVGRVAKTDVQAPRGSPTGSSSSFAIAAGGIPSSSSASAEPASRNSSQCSPPGYYLHPDFMSISAWVSGLFLVCSLLPIALVCIFEFGAYDAVFPADRRWLFELLVDTKTFCVIVNSSLKPIIYFSASERCRLALTDICTCQCRRHVGYSNYVPMQQHQKSQRHLQQQQPLVNGDDILHQKLTMDRREFSNDRSDAALLELSQPNGHIQHIHQMHPQQHHI